MSLEEHIVQLIAALKAHGEALVTHAAAIAKGGKAPKAPKDSPSETSQPAASNATPAASAPAAGQQAQSPAVTPPPVDATLLKATTEAVIELANEYSREKAVGILAARNVSRCSDLKADQLRAVLEEAQAAIAAGKAAKEAATANASLV